MMSTFRLRQIASKLRIAFSTARLADVRMYVRRSNKYRTVHSNGTRCKCIRSTHVETEPESCGNATTNIKSPQPKTQSL